MAPWKAASWWTIRSVPGVTYLLTRAGSTVRANCPQTGHWKSVHSSRVTGAAAWPIVRSVARPMGVGEAGGLSAVVPGGPAPSTEQEGAGHEHDPDGADEQRDEEDRRSTTTRGGATLTGGRARLGAFGRAAFSRESGFGPGPWRAGRAAHAISIGRRPRWREGRLARNDRAGWHDAATASQMRLCLNCGTIRPWATRPRSSPRSTAPATG